MNYTASTTIQNDYPDEYVRMTILKLNRSEITLALKKGIRLFPVSLESGLNGEDFRYDRRTFKLSYKGYKIPRFLKTYLLKKR